VSQSQMESAMSACQKDLPGGSSSGGSSSSNTQAVIQYAQCMRSHGVTNFPEPNAQGQELITSGNGINPNSPTFISANTACQHYLPTGSIGG
jgi:hypothetical protein